MRLILTLVSSFVILASLPTGINRPVTRAAPVPPIAVAVEPPSRPTTFYGTMLIGGAPAPDDTVITAQIAGAVVATTQVFSDDGLVGLYRIDVPGVSGQIVRFRSGTTILEPAGTLTDGDVFLHNLYLDC